MYIEFFILILDYFRTLTRRVVIYEIVIPTVTLICIFLVLHFKGNVSYADELRNNLIALLGILIGFSITIITILITSTSGNIAAIQKRKTQHTIGSRKVSVFDLLLVNFTYSVVVEIFLVVVLLIYPIILTNYDFPSVVKKVVFSILFGIVIHILLLTIRNLTDFYLILMKS